jgi:hypothetical protein
MPIHDWTQVRPGTWHDVHSGWITALRPAFHDRPRQWRRFGADVANALNDF